MLDALEQNAVKAVLSDIARGTRVPRVHWASLLGPEPEVIERIAQEFPDLRRVALGDASIAIHNALNLYVNGLSISAADWATMGTCLENVEGAFEAWQREV